MKKIRDYNHACEVLNRDPKAKIDVSAIEEEDQLAFLDLFELTTIVKANNKLNKWKVDYSKVRYFAWPDIVKDPSKPSGFGLSYFDYVDTSSDASVGSRLETGSREESKYIFEENKSKYESWLLIRQTVSNQEKEAIEKARSIFGDRYEYQLMKGTSVDLSTLNDKQSVCASGIKGHHILMTEK